MAQDRSEVAAGEVGELQVAVWTGPEPLETACGRLGALVTLGREWAERPQWGALHVTADDAWAFKFHDRSAEIRAAIRSS